MGMLISFTGAQSTGKTTLLEVCKEKYPEFTFVDEVTRKVKREYGVNINELGSDETQLLILAEHIKNHMLPSDTILDRCIFDGYVYTKYLHEAGQVSKPILDMFVTAFDYLYGRLDYIFYTEPGDVKLVDDGVRSNNNEFRNSIIESFERLMDNYMDSHKIIRLKGTVEERLQTIEKYIKK
jgi:thymidylate kinase